MPTSSAMITTMLGLFAVVWADAAPPNARGSESIAVKIRLLLIIDVSFHLQICTPISERTSCCTPQEVGQQQDIARRIKKHPVDQRSNENSTPATGDPTSSDSPKIWRASENSEFFAC